MLYIIPIDAYTIKFHDNAEHSQEYGIELDARADTLGRIWISYRYVDGNVLNSCLVSEISLWDGAAYQVYATPAEFVSAFNAITEPVTTEVTTTTTEVTTTTTTLFNDGELLTNEGGDFLLTNETGELLILN